MVNLNKAQKAQAKARASAEAAANRVKFGLTKGQKGVAKSIAAKSERTLDGTKLSD